MDFLNARIQVDAARAEPLACSLGSVQDMGAGASLCANLVSAPNRLWRRRERKGSGDTYTAAIIGAGFISAKRHLPAWLRLRRDVRVAAVCDLDLDRAEAVSREFGVPSAYDDVRQMLDMERLDFVDVCTPPSAHADIAAAALKAGAHVLVEKPLAATVEECERIIEAERESRGRVWAAHTELFHPCVVEARKRVERGEVGDLTGMRIFYSTPVTLMTADPSHFANRLPGGVIGETSPHVAYLAGAFIGTIRDVWARGRKFLSEYTWSPFEDYRLELTGSRATCSAALTYTSKHSAFLLELWGTEGLIKIDMQSKILAAYDRVSQSPWGIGVSSLREAAQIASGALANGFGYLAGRFRNIHDRLIREFVERSVNGLPPSVTAGDGLETVRVMSVISEQLQSQASPAQSGVRMGAA